MTDKQPYLWFRMRGNGGTWHIRDGRILIRTGFRLHDKPSAQARLDQYKAEKASRPVAGTPASRIPVLQVILAALDRIEAARQTSPAAALPKKPPEGPVRLRPSHFAPLRTFWAKYAIGDIGRQTFAAYLAERVTHPRLHGPVGVISLATAIHELELLRAEVRRFVKFHELVGLPVMFLPQKARREGTRLSRDELARLLWAARGRTWDADNKRWDAPSVNKAMIKRARAHIGRMLIVAMYTGSRCSCVVRLLWRPADDRRSSYVDLDAFVEETVNGQLEQIDQPLLYRLGPDAAYGKLEGMPVKLNRRVSAHLKRWRTMDQNHGLGAVVHSQGTIWSLSAAPAPTFGEIVRDAGLPDTITMDDLRYSTGSHLARRADVKARSAAMLLGMGTRDFVTKFGHRSPGYQHEAIAALSKRRTSVRRHANVRNSEPARVQRNTDGS